MEDVLLNPGSYLSIIVILMLTGCGLPLPEEIPIIAAGVASSGSVGHLNPWAALVSCLIGALLGDSMLYAIGYHFGHNLVKAHPRLAHLLHAEREAKMERLLNQHGLKVLLVARFMVGIRAPVYLSIGILRTSFRKFLLFDAFCATAVVGLFFGLSYLFGDNVTKWIRGTEKVVTAIVVSAGIVALIVFTVWRRRQKRPAATQLGAAESLGQSAADSQADARQPADSAQSPGGTGSDSDSGEAAA